jgi:hypothetical protein
MILTLRKRQSSLWFTAWSGGPIATPPVSRSGGCGQSAPNATADYKPSGAVAMGTAGVNRFGGDAKRMPLNTSTLFCASWTPIERESEEKELKRILKKHRRMVEMFDLILSIHKVSHSLP